VRVTSRFPDTSNDSTMRNLREVKKFNGNTEWPVTWYSLINLCRPRADWCTSLSKRNMVQLPSCACACVCVCVWGGGGQNADSSLQLVSNLVPWHWLI
jgi:hypothetical protein